MRLRGWVALTGTPGVGKSAVANALRLRGIPNVNLGAFAQDNGLTEGFDDARLSAVVDPARIAPDLRALTQKGELLLLDGHWGHDVPGIVAAVVLRLRPTVLRTRLERRGWNAAKVRENVEAEAIDLILQEAVGTLGERRVHEVDTTGLTIKEVADHVHDICRGLVPARRFRPGNVDWSADLLSIDAGRNP